MRSITTKGSSMILPRRLYYGSQYSSTIARRCLQVRLKLHSVFEQSPLTARMMSRKISLGTSRRVTFDVQRVATLLGSVSITAVMALLSGVELLCGVGECRAHCRIYATVHGCGVRFSPEVHLPFEVDESAGSAAR